jgi:hypothetical protein
MSSLVADYMFRGFLRRRYKLLDRYPLFYVVMERDEHLSPKQWSSSEIVFADACYTLWLYTLMLSYITTFSRVTDFVTANILRTGWYSLPSFEDYAVETTIEMINRWAAMGEDESIPLETTPQLADSRVFDVRLIESTLDWKIIPVSSAPALVADEDVVFHGPSTMTTTFIQTSIVDTTPKVKTILDNSVGRRFETGLFLEYLHDVLNNLVANNPNGKIPEAILKGLTHRYCEDCRSDVLPALFLHVCTMHAVIGNPSAGFREVELVARQDVVLFQYEKQYLEPIMKRELERGIVEIGRDEGSSSGPAVGPGISHVKLEVYVEFFDILPEDGSRSGLIEPHIYAYFSHNRGVALKDEREADEKTILEMMYSGTEGCMRRLNSNGKASLKLALMGGKEAAYLCVMLFYKQEKDESYTVISRGYTKFDYGGSAVDDTMITFAGPMTSQFSVEQGETAGTVGKIKKNFKYIPDAVVRFGPREGAPIPSRTLPNLLLNPDDEQKINEFTENYYRMAARANLKKPQNFIFKGVPGAIIPINVGALLMPRQVKAWMFNAAYRRMLNRMNISESDFLRIVEREADMRSAWENMRLKHAVIETFNLVNTLTYTNDVVFHKDVDVHQDVRLTNTGDCEDFAWALFSILRTALYSNLKGLDEGVEALIVMLKKEGAEPLFTSMYIDYHDSNLHSAVMIKTHETSRLGNILMEGTGTHHGDFCSLTQFSRDQQESVGWYTALSNEIKEQNKLAGERRFGLYSGPKNSATDEFDQDVDEKFYVGFLGAVTRNGEYVRFIEKGGDIEHLKETGVELCDVINKHRFELASVKGQERVDKAVSDELEHIAALAPPLPEYYEDKRASHGFASRYLNPASVFASTLKDVSEGGFVDESNTHALMNSVSVFYNLVGKKAEDAARDAESLNAAIAAFKRAGANHRISDVEVRVYSMFKGAATLEIVIHRG